MSKKSFALAWAVVYFCRIVLITNGIIYARSGIAYYSQSYDGFELWEDGNSTLYSFPVLQPVIKDAVIEDQFDGLLILAPFMGAAYICVAFTSIAAAFLFRNPEAAMTLLLQAALLSMLGCIVRPYEPAEFYNEGQQKKVQSAQLVAVITGWIGGLGPIIAVLLKQKILTPVEYVVTLYSSFASRDEGDAIE
mmetsp:Transcript_30461/g.46623  ORF Transcript_30461/g.46623 Transcript_30461/m.46623 type:complete len:192 (+) Transcript_30461:110-685(+)